MIFFLSAFTDNRFSFPKQKLIRHRHLINSLDSLSRNSLCVVISLRFLILECYVIQMLFGCKLFFYWAII